MLTFKSEISSGMAKNERRLCVEMFGVRREIYTLRPALLGTFQQLDRMEQTSLNGMSRPRADIGAMRLQPKGKDETLTDFSQI